MKAKPQQEMNNQLPQQQTTVTAASPQRLLAVDPGSEKSGYVIMELVTRKPLEFGKVDNGDLLAAMVSKARRGPNTAQGDALLSAGYNRVSCEFPVPRGQLSSKDMFKTIWWIGRYFQVLHQDPGVKVVEFVDRKDVKMHLCGVPSAKDANIRQAIIDNYGGDSVAIGGKKCKACSGRGHTGRDKQACSQCSGRGTETPDGPLKGIAGDVWSAVGIALTTLDGANKPIILT